MPVIDGEKWACESCIRGHRVSGCTHTDRELQRINPKGRPVKQCEHCRGARQSRSHHARCECGDKKTKGSLKGEESGTPDVEGDSHIHAVDDQSCRCHSGLPCICGMKKEHRDLRMPTGQSKASQALKNKPALTSAHSEATLTVFANGHHKPCHRLNNAAHTSGAPYKIPRAHTLHDSSHHSQDYLEQTYRLSDVAGQSPIAGFPFLDNNDKALFKGFGLPNSSADSLPLTPVTGGVNADITSFDPSPSNLGFTQSSAAPSFQLDGSIEFNLANTSSLPTTTRWPWINTDIPLASQHGFGDFSASPTGDHSITPDVDWNTSSAGLTIPSWTARDLPLDPTRLLKDGLQPISHSGDSTRQDVPSLTASSSGAQSEIDEPAFHNDFDLRPQQPPASSELLAWDDSFQYRSPNPSRFSSASLHLGDLRQAPTSIPMNARHSLNLDLIRRSQYESSLKQRARADTVGSEFEHGNSEQQPTQQPLKGPFGLDSSSTAGDMTSSAFSDSAIAYSSLASEQFFTPMPTSAGVNAEISNGNADWLSLVPTDNSGFDSALLAQLPSEWDSSHVNWQ